MWQLSWIPATKWHSYKIWEVGYIVTIFTAVLSPILKCLVLIKTTKTEKEKKKKRISPPPKKQTITRNLENRDKDSKLPVEEDAGIHSKSFTDGRTGLPIACFLLCRPFSSVSMQSHGLDQGKKYNVQHLPKLVPRPRWEKESTWPLPTVQVWNESEIK